MKLPKFLTINPDFKRAVEYLDFLNGGDLWSKNTKIFFLGQVKCLRDQAANELNGWNAAVKKYEKLIA